MKASTDTCSFLVVFFVLTITFCLVSAGIFKANTTIGIAAYAKKSKEPSGEDSSKDAGGSKGDDSSSGSSSEGGAGSSSGDNGGSTSGDNNPTTDETTPPPSPPTTDDNNNNVMEYVYVMRNSIAITVIYT
jgi:hypothetical protein